MLQAYLPYLPFLIAVAVIAFFVLLMRKARKPKPCVVCGTDTKDWYSDPSDKREPLCRTHLVDRWKKDMRDFRLKMVVVEPDFQKFPYSYLYFGAEELQNYEYPKEATDRIRAIVSTIEKKECASCGKEASVAFYRKEVYEWPNFENLPMSPSSYLCTTCAVSKIALLIQSAPTFFGEALYAPRPLEGIYHAQEW